MEKITEDLKSRLYETIKRNPYEALLLSGGLDSSILAAISPGAAGITVSLGGGGDDILYASSLAKHLKMELYHRQVEVDEAIEAIPSAVKILKSFDPALPNDLAVYFGLEFAKNRGLTTVATGDGSDELFAGYSFMEKIIDLEAYIKRIAAKMNFSSAEIGKFFGVEIIQPFMGKEIVDCALAVPVNLKIKQDKGGIWGKWILRKSFEDMLPPKIIWQEKRPLETGSGMTKLRSILSDRISDKEFKENPFPIKFFNKEHLYYYKIYRSVVGEVPAPQDGERSCPGCGGGVKRDGFHCKICGYVLDSDICG